MTTTDLGRKAVARARLHNLRKTLNDRFEWDIAVALRGPDFDDDVLKRQTTELVRAAVLHIEDPYNKDINYEDSKAGYLVAPISGKEAVWSLIRWIAHNHTYEATELPGGGHFFHHIVQATQHLCLAYDIDYTIEMNRAFEKARGVKSE